MSDKEIIRSWKDPDAGLGIVLSPVGAVELANVAGGLQQADTLLPWFCDRTMFQGTCATGPTRGCC